METTRAFGFTRRGNNITVAMDNAFEFLLYKNLVEEVDGKILIIRD